jgi:MSHA biogenesis protein MshN
MSLINQVLNQLEQRGVAGMDATSMVRPVPVRVRSNQRIVWGLLLLGLVAVTVMLFLQVQGRHKHAPSKPLPVTMQSIPTVALSSVAAAPPVLQLSFALDTVVLPVLSLKPEQVPMASKPVKTPATLKEPPKQAVLPPVSATNELLPLKQVSAKQQAEAAFRKGLLLMQQGRISDALASYRTAISLDAAYDPARQALVSLLLENKHRAEAEQVLQDGLSNRLEHTTFAMMAARLQVERNAVNEALLTLERSLPFAQQQGDYQAFFAALLQRQNRHQDALLHYQIAVQLVPNNGLWLMGEGISLQALQRNEEAKELYKRALLTQTLQPDLQLFVQQKLKALQ